MIKAEWKHLMHNRKMRIVVFAVILIPLIYAGIFLRGAWDPYGNADQLPVAVANEDKPADYEGETLNIGDETIANLKKNDELNWTFTSEKQARQGVKDGDYYMAVVIPGNFSEHAATVFDEHPEKMELDYYTNPGMNYTAGQISEQAAEGLYEEIADSVTGEYAQAMLTQLGDIEEGLQDGSDGAGELKKGNEELESNLAVLSDSTLTFRDGLEEAADGSGNIERNMSSAADGAEELNEGVHAYTSSAGDLNEGIQQYVQGAGSLDTGVQKYTGAAGNLNSGVQQYTAGVNELDRGIQSFSSGTQELGNGLEQYTSGTEELEAGLIQQREGTQELAAYNDELTSGSRALADGLQEAAPGMRALNEEVQAAASEAEALSNIDSSSVEAAVDDVMKDIRQEAGSSSKEADQLTETLRSIADQKNSSTDIEGKAEAEEALLVLSDAVDRLEASDSSSSAPEQVASLINNTSADLTEEQEQILLQEAENTETSQSSLNKDEVTEAVQQMAAALDALSAPETSGAAEAAASGLEAAEALERSQNQILSMTENSSLVSQITTILPDISGDASFDKVTALASSTEELSEGLDELSDGASVLQGSLEDYTQGVEKLDEGAQTLAEGAGSLTSQSNALLTGADQITEASAELAEGSRQLAGQSAGLSEGAQAFEDNGEGLAEGSAELAGSGGELTEGGRALASSGSDLNKGAGSLTEGLPQLQQALQSLNTGLVDLQDGSVDLASGTDELQEGAGSLVNGAGDLSGELADGAGDIRAVGTGNENSDMFSSPLLLGEHELSSVPNYGHAMAPYMMAVALFLGSVIFCLLYPVKQPETLPSSGIAWWLSKFSILLPVSILQAVVMAGVVLWMGVDVQSTGLVFLTAVVSALAFMAIVQFFAVVFGNPGRFIVLILMILQLVAAGGTMPVELLNHFFQQINPFLPMTYTVSAYREAIFLGGSITTELLILTGIFVIFHTASIFYFTWKAKRYEPEPVSSSS
ncbi:YhgE/Pip domain-containing protein [Sinobaca qinghaiensis]|nr:YhgE/Pip domain-containing protein [Sinobaca qinghaiensis]